LEWKKRPDGGPQTLPFPTPRADPVADMTGIAIHRSMTPDEVHDPATFARFVSNLRLTLDNPDLAGDWENRELSRFFKAMSAWAIDWPKPADSNPWRHAADLLAAAAIYE
jgi:hypothetical protein